MYQKAKILTGPLANHFVWTFGKPFDSKGAYNPRTGKRQGPAKRILIAVESITGRKPALRMERLELLNEFAEEIELVSWESLRE